MDARQPLVLVADPIAEEGLAILRQHARVETVTGDREALERNLKDADALVVRSETRVTAAMLQSAPLLRVIGRAGAGVDTIDVAAATTRGIVVVNAPGGNAVAAAEHTLALLFALVRRIAAADASMKRGQWARNAYVGTELSGKTLGLIGLGRVGGEVARRALGLDMHVLVYDPYVPDEHARRIGLQPAELEPLLEASDFVSLHVPLTEATRGILGARPASPTCGQAPSCSIARGPAWLTKLRSSPPWTKAAWRAPPSTCFRTSRCVPTIHCRGIRKVVATPHLGASTVEAQANVAVQIANEVLAVLEGRPAQFAVNAPSLRPEDVEALEPYLDLVVMLGKLATQLADDHLVSAEISYRGEIAERNVGVLTAAAIQGLLEPISASGVNLVNARLVAQQRGLDIVETRSYI